MRAGLATTERGRKRPREVHGRSSARGPSDRTLIPFKGEARRRYAVVHHVDERGEEEKDGKREAERSWLRRVTLDGRRSTQNGVVRGRDRGGRKREG